MKPILEIQHISKKYKLRGQETPYLTIRDAILGKNKRKKVDEFWALDDINFNVYPGESIGIIGKNGAGKSTLLKILSKITPPTKGKIISRGRIASLLEVGTGFHAELTGMENIFLNGSILGLKKTEIKKRLDEIIDFSGIEKFIETPLKHYSSGMQLRLAFSVAAHLEPEILIIDEVLAVGDIDFQKKSLGKMDDVVKGGRTVIFVSHNMSAVSTLTAKSILLNNGQQDFIGLTGDAIQQYQKFNNLTTSYNLMQVNEYIEPKITHIEVVTSNPLGLHKQGKDMKIIFDIKNTYQVKNAAISFQIYNEMNIPCVHLWYYGTENKFLEKTGEHRLECFIPTLRLYQGNYTLSVFFAKFGGEVFDKLLNICSFKIEMIDKKRDYPWQKNSCVYIEDSKWIKTK